MPPKYPEQRATEFQGNLVADMQTIEMNGVCRFGPGAIDMECNCVTQRVTPVLQTLSKRLRACAIGDARHTLIVIARVSCVTCVACMIACSRAADHAAGGESYAERSHAVAQIIERSCTKQTCDGELSANAPLAFMQPDFRCG